MVATFGAGTMQTTCSTRGPLAQHVCPHHMPRLARWLSQTPPVLKGLPQQHRAIPTRKHAYRNRLSCRTQQQDVDISSKNLKETAALDQLIDLLLSTNSKEEVCLLQHLVTCGACTKLTGTTIDACSLASLWQRTSSALIRSSGCALRPGMTQLRHRNRCRGGLHLLCLHARCSRPAPAQVVPGLLTGMCQLCQAAWWL